MAYHANDKASIKKKKKKKKKDSEYPCDFRIFQIYIDIKDFVSLLFILILIYSSIYDIKIMITPRNQQWPSYEAIIRITIYIVNVGTTK